MAVDSNKPVGRVHNGGDGIWDGAGWGAAAGVGAMGLAYGTSVHGAKHLSNLTSYAGGKLNSGMISNNSKNRLKGKRNYSENVMSKRLSNANKMTDTLISGMDNLQKAGSFGFGSGKRAIVSGATGLLGGMMAGAAIDHNN